MRIRVNHGTPRAGPVLQALVTTTRDPITCRQEMAEGHRHVTIHHTVLRRSKKHYVHGSSLGPFCVRRHLQCLGTLVEVTTGDAGAPGTEVGVLLNTIQSAGRCLEQRTAQPNGNLLRRHHVK